VSTGVGLTQQHVRAAEDFFTACSSPCVAVSSKVVSKIFGQGQIEECVDG